VDLKEHFQICTYANILAPYGFFSGSTELFYEPKKWLQPVCMTKLYGVYIALRHFKKS
jgi:hypothetical protein